MQDSIGLCECRSVWDFVGARAYGTIWDFVGAGQFMSAGLRTLWVQDSL